VIKHDRDVRLVPKGSISSWSASPSRYFLSQRNDE
jgi:hypothetical protein